MLDLLLHRIRGGLPKERGQIYWKSVDLMLNGPELGLRETSFVVPLLLETLASDRDMPADFAVRILAETVRHEAIRAAFTSVTPILRCALTFLGRDPDVDLKISRLVRPFIRSGSGQPEMAGS